MKDIILYSDEELMQEIKADNMFAFDVLYKKYNKRLYKFGYSILKSQEDAENLIQDVYLNLWENRYKVEKDCKDEHNWWAENMGGMIDQRIDMALTALTSSSDDRKVIVSWTPGKSILSNTVIPCIHADPCIGDLAPGESRTVCGVLIFSCNSLESVINELSKQVTTMTIQK
jgi:hypothetical protein